MVFKRLASRLVKVNLNGVTQMKTMAQAILMQNMKAALSQDQVAMGNVWRLMEANGEFLDRNNPELAGKPIVVPERRHDIEALLEEHGVGIVKMPSSHQRGDS